MLVLCFFCLHGSGVLAVNPYDFGLIENEPLLRQLCRKDRLVHSELVRLNSVYNSAQLDHYLKHVHGKISDVSVNDFVKHPVNAFNLIRRASIQIKSLVFDLQNEDENDNSEIIEALRQRLNETKIYKSVSNKDMYGALKVKHVVGSSLSGSTGGHGGREWPLVVKI